MKMLPKCATLVLALAAFLMAEVGFAGPKTLIEMEGGTPSAGLAKSWKKVKDGEYSFDLDTTKEIGKGVNVSQSAVKTSLESKLGSSYGVKVTAQGASAVAVTYTGDEKKFLEQIAKTKIRGENVELALESSVSEGGIRAKITDRPPSANEVKALVMKIEGDTILAKASESKSAKIKSGDKVKIKGTLKGAKKNDVIFFKPEKKAGDAWVPAAGSLQ